MKRIILMLIIMLFVIALRAQEKGVIVHVYLSPSICQISTQHRIFNNGIVTLTDMEKSSGLFFGAGFVASKSLKNNWLVGADFGFQSKGYFAVKETIYYDSNYGGSGFSRTDLNFWEPAIFIGKQFPLKNPDYKIQFSTGLFYGFHSTNLFTFRVEAKGNDIGPLISAGVVRNKIFVKLEYKKGLRNIENNINTDLKTNILSFKLGYKIF